MGLPHSFRLRAVVDPHLAKNERDMGHPNFVAGQESKCGRLYSFVPERVGEPGGELMNRRIGGDRSRTTDPSASLGMTKERMVKGGKAAAGCSFRPLLAPHEQADWRRPKPNCGSLGFARDDKGEDGEGGMAGGWLFISPLLAATKSAAGDDKAYVSYLHVHLSLGGKYR